MKWINLAERQPEPDTKDLIIRGIKWRTIWHHDEANIPLNDPKSWSEFEWLDESVEELPIEQTRAYEQNELLQTWAQKHSGIAYGMIGDHLAAIEKKLTPEEGYMLIQVPVGSYVLPDNSSNFIHIDAAIHRIWNRFKLWKLAHVNNEDVTNLIDCITGDLSRLKTK